MTSCFRSTLASVCLGGAAAACVSSPVRLVSGGAIQGCVDATTAVEYYAGIPFAEPPVAALRWAPPLPKTAWTGVLQTLTYAPACQQFDYVDSTASEDCLYINVFVPPEVQQGLSACADFWIHGGGFVGGSGGFAADAAFAYVLGTGCILVTTQYRLGLLGYMALPGMPPAYPTPPAGTATHNVGLLDQQAGLLWAQANVAAFGADPRRVILSGQSAGGSSVLFQYTLPGSYGTYRAALSQSPGDFTVPLDVAESVATSVATAVNCTAAEGYDAQLACLRAVPAATLITAGVAVTGTGFLTLTEDPCVDGYLVTAPPTAAMVAGNFNRNATLLIGGTLFEGDSLLTGWTNYKYGSYLNVLTQAQYNDSITQLGYMTALNASVLASINALYTPLGQSDGWYNASSRIWGDGILTCNVAWAAHAVAATGTPVFRYLVNATLPQTGGAQPAGRATHGTDMSLLYPTTNLTSTEAAVSADFHGYITNAAVTGDVNTGPHAVETQWPPFVAGESSVLTMNELHEYGLIPDWQEDFCETWWSLLP